MQFRVFELAVESAKLSRDISPAVWCSCNYEHSYPGKEKVRRSHHFRDLRISCSPYGTIFATSFWSQRQKCSVSRNRCKRWLVRQLESAVPNQVELTDFDRDAAMRLSGSLRQLRI